MFKIKWILVLLVGFGFAGCQTANIPEPYNFRVKDLQKNPYGCWMEVTVDSASAVIHHFTTQSGELLTMNRDSVILLIADGKVKSIHIRSILASKLYTHKNQSGTYLLMTGLYMIPAIIGALANPDYVGEFMLLTVPVTIVGVFQSVKDGTAQRNVLVYPAKNNLDDFKPFARFPAGMPKDIDFGVLYLKR
jgi:hypothetical protein